MNLCRLPPGRGRVRPAAAAARLALLLAALYSWVAPCPAAEPASRPTSAPASGSVVWSARPAAEYLRLVQDLSAPEMEGRGPGTAGIEKARDYVIERFREAGLSPAFGESYVQPFPLAVGLKAQKQSLRVLDANGAPLFTPRPGEEFSAMGVSPDANFRGRAVWVGYGVRDVLHGYDSYGDGNGEPLWGKVAVAFRYEPQDANGRSLWYRGGAGMGEWSLAATFVNKAEWAAERGAVAMVVVNPPSQDPNEPLRTAAETAGRPGTRIPVLQISSRAMERLLGLAGWEDGPEALARLQAQADRAGGTPRAMGNLVLEGQVSLTPATTTAHNVAGVLRGSGTLAEEVIVIGAHYDHLGAGPVGSRAGAKALHPGADDNASGTAGVMTLARWLAAAAGDANAPKDRRTLLFVAFSGEERGLIGSAHFVRHIAEAGLRPQQVVAMLNLDMIGRLRYGQLFVMGADSASQWRAILEEAGQGSGLDLRVTGSGVGGSDQGSFYYGLKVPVLHFFTGTHAEYHTPRDTADRINAPGAVQVLRLVAAVAEDLWQRPTRLTYVAPRSGAGGGAYLGIIPDEAGEEGKGVFVAAVAPGGPAEHAGIQAGDAVVRLNDKPIRSLKDLQDALAAARPGDKVRLVVQRQGKTLDVEAKLGRRGG